MERISWNDLCQREDCRGRWIALDDCRYDEVTGRATEGCLIDIDDDLVELCQRIRNSDRKNCSIVFCTGEFLESASHCGEVGCATALMSHSLRSSNRQASR